MTEPTEAALDPVAARLLDAQVLFALDQLRGENFHGLVIDEIEHFLAEVTEITLAESVTPAMIKDTAAKYTVQVPVEGAIPELVGEIGARIHELTVAADTPIGELLAAPRFAELAEAVAEMDLTARVLDRALSRPEVADVCADLARRALTDVVAESATRRGGATGFVAGIGARLLTGPRWADRAERITRRATRFLLTHLRADEELLAQTLTDLWRENLDTPVSSVGTLISAGDVEDAIVVVFEFWRSFRDTDYFRSLLDAGIDEFFAKYGDTSLYDLLAELGVGREDMIEEALRFGPPVLAMLDERGDLAAVLRRRLLPFYASEQFRAALAGD